MKTFTVTIEEDPKTGDLILPFADEMLKHAGWAVGDTVIWQDNKNGTWSLIKKTLEIESHGTQDWVEP